LKELARTSEPGATRGGLALELDSVPARSAGGKDDFDEGTILLANGPGELARIEPDWSVDSRDWEQIQSHHRWNWLLTALSGSRSRRVRPWGFEKMRGWLAVHGAPGGRAAWTTYTVAERVTNSLLFCLCAPAERGEALVPAWLALALESHASWIATHLEYYGPGLIGNHILNNARGLYFYGRIFGAPRFERTARELLRRHIPELLGTCGFLREGSSHYQFLITRWLLEVLWLAGISGDEEMNVLLRPWLAATVARCWFFLVEDADSGDWSMPLLGDISPDFTPAWLMGLVWSDIARSCYEPEAMPSPPLGRGWESLFSRAKTAAAGGAAWRPEPGMSAFPDVGWYRLNLGRLTLFWHAEPGGTPLHPSHGHCDTGSFCLYVDGRPVLVDPGRSSYTAEDQGSTTAAAHNSLRLDGLDPFVYRRVYPPCYRAATVRVDWDDGAAPFLSITHDGFRRTGTEILHRRTWRTHDETLEIEDVIEGSGEHRIETFFQCAPGIEEPLAMIDFSGSAGLTIRLVRGWYSEAYGQRIPAVTIVCEQTATLPVTNRYLIRTGTSRAPGCEAAALTAASRNS
jgi:hypothetical protein